MTDMGIRRIIKGRTRHSAALLFKTDGAEMKPAPQKNFNFYSPHKRLTSYF